jgi:hypothetical protein
VSFFLFLPAECVALGAVGKHVFSYPPRPVLIALTHGNVLSRIGAGEKPAPAPRGLVYDPIAPNPA